MEQAVATQTVQKRAMPKRMVNSYVNNQLMGLSKEQLLLTVYDIAITGCQQKDGDKAIRAISELISALNFEHQDIAIGLFRLYQYAIDKVREKNYDEVIGILQGLRESWATAFQQAA
ncbi:flagellar protein FliS [candidate division KSB1 bacterium]|nr:flagellar protein FliS [candidate division KSB1 bacterium]